jgi:hypothetical protein
MLAWIYRIHLLSWGFVGEPSVPDAFEFEIVKTKAQPHYIYSSMAHYYILLLVALVSLDLYSPPERHLLS